MTSIKIAQFSRPPTLLVHLRPKFFQLLDLGRPISNKPPSSNDNQSSKRKHNPRMTIICYQVPQVVFRFQYHLINFAWLSIDFFSLHWNQPRYQSTFKKLKTSFSPSSYSEKMSWGQGWAEASLSAFLWLYFLKIFFF